MSQKLDQQYRLQSVQNALEALELFIHSDKRELRLTEISRSLDLAKSQTYRLLQNLIEYGYLSQDQTTKRYSLGLKFLFAGHVVRKKLDLVQEAEPVLDRLCNDTQETVHLTLVTPEGPVCVAEQQGSYSLRFFASIGLRLPWHAGSASKLLLAYAPSTTVETVLDNGQLTQFTPNTIIDPDKLREELEGIRSKGYSTSHSEMSIGAYAVAAPIRNYSQDVIAALSIVGPVERFEQKLPDFISAVQHAASNLSQRVGYS